MKKSLIKITAIMGTLISLVACSSTNNISDHHYFGTYKGVKQLRDPKDLDHSYTYEEYSSEGFVAFKNKMRAFSTKLSDSLIKREYVDGANLAISPLSIEMCLGLAIKSSNGSTRQEMLDAIGIDYETFNQYYKLFFNTLIFESKNSDGELMAQLLLTNSIWIDDDITLKDDGLDALRDDYYCNSFAADFNEHNKESNQAIRDFIKEKTKGLIDQDLELSPYTLFVLMNTLYIKDIWNEEGRDLLLADFDNRFTNSDGTVSSQRLLRGNYNTGRTLETENYSSFYTSTNSGYRIYFVKPNAGKVLKEIFNEETMNYVLDKTHYVYQDDEKMEKYFTNCIFPEYEANCDIDLTKPFKEDFNVRTLFTDDCDMSPLTDKEVFVKDFRQIAKLEVNKKGIEGAAVTYMAYAATSAPDVTYKDVYETFNVDKEFGYILTRGDNVIFSGVVTNIDK